ncbi:hypothetical protein BDR03DRAFT_949313 [Suillus americanus]|nr:hypothetical protein BDR03DRAFT_949313 [Suillus americanus]
MALAHVLLSLLIERPVISENVSLEAQNEEWNNSELLKMASADLVISYPADGFLTDVDLECLTTLEARMFGSLKKQGLQATSSGV